MSQKAGAEPTLFLSMDALRGIGALLIVLAHSSAFWGPFAVREQLSCYFVDMFFLFSGVVIAFAFEPRFATGMRTGDFMLQRLIRLYPVYIIGTLVSLPAMLWTFAREPVGATGVAEQVIPQLFFLPSMMPAHTDTYSGLYTLDGPAWSLFFELWANLLYILIWRWLNLRTLVAVVIGFAITLAFAVYHYGTLHSGWAQDGFWGGFARAGFGFFGGVLLYRLIGSPRKLPTKTSVLSVTPIALLPFLAIITVPGFMQGAAQLTVAFFIGPAVLTVGLLVQPPKALWKISERAGALSYPIYLLHWPFVLAAEEFRREHPAFSEHYGYVIGIGIVLASVVSAYFVERYFDVPVRRWLGQQVKARKKRREAAAAAAKQAGVGAAAPAGLKGENRPGVGSARSRE